MHFESIWVDFSHYFIGLEVGEVALWVFLCLGILPGLEGIFMVKEVKTELVRGFLVKK